MSGQELSKRDAASVWYIGRNIRRDGVKGRVLTKVVRNLRFTLITLEDRVARL